MGLPNPSRETKFPGAHADREIFIFSVQLATSRIGNLTLLIHTLAILCDDHTYRRGVTTYYVTALSYCKQEDLLVVVFFTLTDRASTIPSSNTNTWLPKSGT